MVELLLCGLQLLQVVVDLLQLLLPKVYLSAGSLALEVLIHGEFLHPIAVQLNSRDRLHEALQLTAIVFLVAILEAADQVLHKLVALQDLFLDGLVELGEVEAGLQVVAADNVQTVCDSGEEQTEYVEDSIEIGEVEAVRAVCF